MCIFTYAYEYMLLCKCIHESDMESRKHISAVPSLPLPGPSHNLSGAALGGTLASFPDGNDFIRVGMASHHCFLSFL